MNGFVHLLRNANPEVAPGAVRLADFAGVFLVLIFLMTFAIGGLFVWFAVRQSRIRRKHRGAGSADAGTPAEASSTRGFLTFVRQPAQWIAIRSSNLDAVLQALHLHNPIPCSWQEDPSAHSKHRLFLSAPVGGWILIRGQALPDLLLDVDDCFCLLQALSNELGEVQWFAMDRVLHHHGWARAINGQILRAYAWAGQTLWNQGLETQGERSLGMVFDDYCDPARHSFFGVAEDYRCNTEKVNLLAARWSLDPTTLDDRVLLKTHGVSGDIFPAQSQT